jgi:hypothetical protein
VDPPPDVLAEAGFSIEEVIGPDGRYVLYYRWADDVWADDAGGAQLSPDTASAPPLRPDAPDV